MELSLVWSSLGLLGAVVVAAFLVNHLAPARRGQIRRAALLFVAFAVALAGHQLARVLGSEAWSRRLFVATELLGAFTATNVVVMITFDAVLPRLRIRLPTIMGDLAAGMGYLLATLGVLSGHGLDPSSLVATSAVVSAVLAISLQSTLGNILGGVALQLDGSVHEGDWIELQGGKQGRVRQIRWRHTVVETRDWSTIIVPNAQLLANNITILGKREGRDSPYRMWVWFNVDYRFAPDEVIRTVNEALRATPIEGVAAEPAPNVVCMDFSHQRLESYAAYGARYWLTDLAADDPTSSRVRARIHAALHRAKIPFALPITAARVHMDNTPEDDARRSDQRRQRNIEALESVPLFRSLAKAELETLASGLSHMIYAPGEQITAQGRVAHYLYVLARGTVEIRTKVSDDGEERAVATLAAPDVFGEMGLMTGAPRLASVVATTQTECYRLGRETFERVILARPKIADELSATLAERSVGLAAAREEIDEGTKRKRTSDEQERIVTAIRSFFGL